MSYNVFIYWIDYMSYQKKYQTDFYISFMNKHPLQFYKRSSGGLLCIQSSPSSKIIEYFGSCIEECIDQIASDLKHFNQEGFHATYRYPSNRGITVNR
jgi:hypothetical protein